MADEQKPEDEMAKARGESWSTTMVDSKRSHQRPYGMPGSVGGWSWMPYGLRGTPPIYVGDKEATATDVNPKHSRFLISSCMEQSLLDFLTEEERRIVSRVPKKKEAKKASSTEKKEKERKESVAVRVIDGHGIMYDMSLTRWCNNSLNLTGRWMWFAANNGLVSGQTVRMWASRLLVPGGDGATLCLFLELRDPDLRSPAHELEKEVGGHVLCPRDDDDDESYRDKMLRIYF